MVYASSPRRMGSAGEVAIGVVAFGSVDTGVVAWGTVSPGVEDATEKAGVVSAGVAAGVEGLGVVLSCPLSPCVVA